MPEATRRANVAPPPPPKPKPKAPPPPPKKEAPKVAAAGGPPRDGLAQTGKTQFVRPVDGGTVTSKFGPRTLGGKQEFHNGYDIAVPEGTPVKAAAAGKVVETGNQPGGAGNYVVIDHGGGYTTKYFHLSTIGVKEGQMVQQGEEIAKSGNTGRSTGPHLHFEVHKDGKPVDPEPYLNGKAAELNLDDAGNAQVAGGPGAAPAGAEPGG
ncbi:MAG: M23 family metallopeptidase, partial [Candidatus Sericytochromatia bacterium]|nr:M23 family metallopeptidase [Candidatus Tanganyikabacteria bacterium]